MTRGLRAFLGATYAASLKSATSDEWINTYAIRPVASVLVWCFYRLRFRPVWVVLLGTVVGSAAAVSLCAWPRPWALPLAGALLLLKNFLDAADGQLARATDRVDRIGRFADSLSDFWVNAAIGLALAIPLGDRFPSAMACSLGAAVGLSLLLQCSLFVFYQVSFLNRERPEAVNRTDERVRPDDASAPRLERLLQRGYLYCYGWQDRWMARIDRALLGALAERPPDDPLLARWYSDRLGLRLTSFLGLGTTLTGLALALCAGRAELALLWVLGAGNGWAVVALLYRALWLGPALRRTPLKAGGGTSR